LLLAKTFVSGLSLLSLPLSGVGSQIIDNQASSLTAQATAVDGRPRLGGAPPLPCDVARPLLYVCMEKDGADTRTLGLPLSLLLLTPETISLFLLTAAALAEMAVSPI
jgi:hypothetical protein